MKTLVNINQIFLALTLLVLSSCEKVIEPKDLPEQDARIVLNSVLYSDSAVSAHISSSKSILSGKDYKFIDNANCELFEDDQFIEKLLFKKNGRYEGNTFPKTGKKYTLKVSASGFEPVEGSSSMTSSVVIKNVARYDSVMSNFNIYAVGDGNVQLGGSVKYKLSVIDDVNTSDYYSLQAVIKLYDTAGAQIPEELASGYVSIYNNVSENGFQGGSYYGDFIVVNDESLVNGNEIVMDISISVGYSYEKSIELGRMEVFLRASHISSDYYKYLQTFNAQASQGPNWFSEPVLVYNNIKGGMGIVGCVNRSLILVYNRVP